MPVFRRFLSLFPAWAGVILAFYKDDDDDDSFPRMGGGDPVALPIYYHNIGFSPHGRG